MIVSLDDLEEQSGSVFDWLGEDLKEVALVIVVDQDLQFLKHIDIFFYLNASMLKTLPESLVVSVRDGKELNTSVRECSHCLNDVRSIQGYVLNSSTTVVLDVFLDLRFSLARSGLINWHLNILIEVSNHNRSK